MRAKTLQPSHTRKLFQRKSKNEKNSLNEQKREIIKAEKLVLGQNFVLTKKTHFAFFLQTNQRGFEALLFKLLGQQQHQAIESRRALTFFYSKR